MLIQSQNYIQFFQEEFARRCKQNPRYSLRAFAAHLKLSPGVLSEILRGKRKLTFKAAIKIAKTLSLSADETQYLLLLVQQEEGEAEQGALTAFRRPERSLTLDMFHVISDWYCTAILALAECDGFSWAPRSIARRLAITETEARVALERLGRVGLIEKNSGGYQAVEDYVMSPSGVPSEAIKSFHRQILEKASLALDAQAIEEREIAGITLALAPSEIHALKKEINQFLDHLAQKHSRSKNKKNIHQIEVAFFRLSQQEKNT